MPQIINVLAQMTLPLNLEYNQDFHRKQIVNLDTGAFFFFFISSSHRDNFLGRRQCYGEGSNNEKKTRWYQ